MGKSYPAEDSTDKFRWDELSLLVILNLLGIEFLFAKGKNSAGDDLSVATSLGITFETLWGIIL